MRLQILIVFSIWISMAGQSASGSTLTEQLSLIYKDTYLVYGFGRRSERDLPVCESAFEACNIAHKRLWLTPITERLCRCPRRAECPISYETRAQDSQHISNRAQLKFCEGLDDTTELCSHEQPAVETTQEKMQTANMAGLTSRAKLFCKCPWPNHLALNKTTQFTDTFKQLYTCNMLSRCSADDICGLVRKDTFEVSYHCSCPEEHLCAYKQPLTTASVSDWPLFQGEVYTAACKKV